MRRYVLIGLCLMGSVDAAYAESKSLQTFFLRKVFNDFSEKTPYTAKLGAVSGNVFGTAVIHDVRFYVDGAPLEILTIKKLRVNLRWKSLLRKDIEFQDITLVDPLVHVYLDEQGKWRLPKSTGTPEASAFGFSTAEVHVQRGTVLLSNAALSIKGETLLRGLDMHFSVTTDTVKMHRLDARSTEGTIHAEGNIGWKPQLTSQLEWKARGVRFDRWARFFAHLPESFQFPYSGSGSLRMGARINEFNSQGTLAGSPLTLDATMVKDGPYQASVKLAPLSVARVWTEASLRGVNTIRGTLKLSAPTFHSKHIDGSGSLQSEWMRLNLALKEGQGQISLQAATTDFTFSSTGQLNLPAERIHQSLTLTVNGFTGLAEYFPPLSHMRGKWAGTGEVSGPFQAWTLKAHLKGEAIRWKEKSVATINLGVSGSKNSWRLHSEVGEIRNDVNAVSPWDLEATALSVEGGTSSMQIDLAQAFRNNSKIRLTGDLQKQGLAWRLVGHPFQWTLPNGAVWQTTSSFRLSVTDKGPTSVSDLTIHSGDARIGIPRAFYEPEKVQLLIKGDGVDPAGFGQLFTGVTFSANNRFDFNAEITGSLEEPQVNGRVAGKVSEVKIDSIGLKLRHLDADLSAHGKTLEIHRFEGKTERGQIELSGKSELPMLDYKIIAEGIQVKKKKLFDAEGDVEARVTGTLSAPRLVGQVTLTRATYNQEPKSFLKRQQKAKATASRSPTIWKRLSMDMASTWKNRVWYRSGMTGIETLGDLRLQKFSSSTELFLTGTIQSIRGEAEYYGRRFEIESGALNFTGPPDVNPIVQVRAVNRSDVTEVYLDISGRPPDIKLLLTSNPPLPEQDVLSVLVLGRPLHQIQDTSGGNEGHQDMLMSAAGSALSGYLTQSLRATGLNLLELDTLRIVPTTEGTSVTVGRYIGSKLYVSYGQTVGETQRVFSADYSLSDRWRLEGQTGTKSQSTIATDPNHVDLIFRYPLNQTHLQRASRVRANEIQRTGPFDERRRAIP